MVDSQKGVINGSQLTYFSGDEHLIVDGKKERNVFTRMKKKSASAAANTPQSAGGIAASPPQ